MENYSLNSVANFLDRYRLFFEPALQRAAEVWIVFEQAVHQVIVCGQRNQRKRWHAVDRNDDRLIFCRNARNGLNFA